jgi:hypothetical protein
VLVRNSVIYFLHSVGLTVRNNWWSYFSISSAVVPVTRLLYTVLLYHTHKILKYVEYSAVSDVFQNIDPPPPSPASECVLPPHRTGHRTRTAPGGEGVGGQYFGRRQP